jgi:hypothetical protein
VASYSCPDNDRIVFYGLPGVGTREQPIKYEKQDQQGKAALNERNPHTTQQQEPTARSPGGPQT